MAHGATPGTMTRPMSPLGSPRAAQSNRATRSDTEARRLVEDAHALEERRLEEDRILQRAEEVRAVGTFDLVAGETMLQPVLWRKL